MFVATVVNFLVSSVTTGNEVAYFIVFIRKALILDIDHPLSEKRELVNRDRALQNMITVNFWASNIPVSIKLSLPDPISIHAR